MPGEKFEYQHRLLPERCCNSFCEGFRSIIRGEEPTPIVCIQDITAKDPDKSNRERFTGRYEKNVESFPLEKVCLKDGELYCSLIRDGEDTEVCRLYPIGENTFTRKNGTETLVFCGDQLTIDERACRKL